MLGVVSLHLLEFVMRTLKIGYSVPFELWSKRVKVSVRLGMCLLEKSVRSSY